MEYELTFSRVCVAKDGYVSEFVDAALATGYCECGGANVKRPCYVLYDEPLVCVLVCGTG